MYQTAFGPMEMLCDRYHHQHSLQCQAAQGIVVTPAHPAEASLSAHWGHLMPESEHCTVQTTLTTQK